MLNTTHRSLRSLLAAGFVFGSCVMTTFAEQGDPLVPNRMVIETLNAKQRSRFIASFSEQFGAITSVDSIPATGFELFAYTLPVGSTTGMVHDVLDAMMLEGAIVVGELDYEGSSGEGRTGSLWLSSLPVNDLALEEQYSRSLLGLDAAWTRSMGAGVVVAVIDGGITPAHPWLGGRVAQWGVSFVPGESLADVGNGIDDDGDGLIDEQVGHGTFVAGLIHWVAPEALILPIRVLNSDGITTNFRTAKAIHFASTHNADIINLSLGSDYDSVVVKRMVRFAVQNGAVVLAAAGNRAAEDPREYPASDQFCIGVTALDWFDVKAPFASFGTKIDLAAPGRTLFKGGSPVTSRAIIGPVPNGIAVWEGTSFASAFAAGTAALVRAQHPSWPDEVVTADLIATEVEAVLGNTGPNPNTTNPEYPDMLGTARIDASLATLLAPNAPRLADLNADGVVGAIDLTIMLDSWALGGFGLRCDLNGDAFVGAQDLSILLSAWNEG